jgi:hypothetical protein
MWTDGVQRIALWSVLLFVLVMDERSPAGTMRYQIAAVDGSTPSLITLHLKDALAQDAYGEIARQAKVPIKPWPANLWTQVPKVNIDVDRQPFWRVMQQLAEQTGLAPGNASREREILLRISPAWARAPSYYGGCVLFVLDSINVSKSIDYTGLQQSLSNMYLRMSAYTDPNVDVLQMQMLRPDEALDQNGNSFLGTRPLGSGMAHSVGSPWCWEVQQSLQYTPGISKRIARLKGSARFVLCTKRETWEVADIQNAKDVVRQTPLATYTIKGLIGHDANVPAYQLKIQIKVPSYESPVANFSDIGRSIRLVDASGRAYTISSSGGGGVGGGPLEHTITFNDRDRDGQNVGPPVKLIWEIPVETKDLIVPLELNDLALPEPGTVAVRPHGPH